MLGENIKSVFSEILHGKAVAPHSVKQEKNDDNTQYSNYGKAATEFSNFNNMDNSHSKLVNISAMKCAILKISVNQLHIV